jgi:hypothetical protein
MCESSGSGVEKDREQTDKYMVFQARVGDKKKDKAC